LDAAIDPNPEVELEQELHLVEVQDRVGVVALVLDDELGIPERR
jgi:hypothetical protein